MKNNILDYIFYGIIGLITGNVTYSLCTIAVYTHKIYELLETMM